MNTLPTYNEQFNKITEAYIMGEIKPFDPCFCFCGTLAPDYNWNGKSLVNKYDPSKYDYTPFEYGRMEKALFSNFPEVEWLAPGSLEHPDTHEYYLRKGYEDLLFNGMVAALEVLKQIHIERGETIDAPPVFIQRPIIEPCK